MVKIGYKGQLPFFNIKVGNGTISNWKKDDIKEFPDEQANILLKSKHFYEVSESKPKVKKEKVVEVIEEPVEDIPELVEEEVDEEIIDEENIEY